MKPLPHHHKSAAMTGGQGPQVFCDVGLEHGREASVDTTLTLTEFCQVEPRCGLSLRRDGGPWTITLYPERKVKHTQYHWTHKNVLLSKRYLGTNAEPEFMSPA